MNGVPPQNNPLSIAKESMTMGKESGDKTFKLLALVMIASAGMATLFHAVHMVWRDMRGGGERSRGNGRTSHAQAMPQYADSGSGEMQPPEAETGAERNWVRTAGRSERASEGGHAREAQRERHDYDRQR